MERFLQAIRARVDTDSLRKQLQASLDVTPRDAPDIARALTMARQQGSLTAPEFQTLMSLVNQRPAPADQKTRFRPETAPDAPPGIDTAPQHTEQRLGDPHTWTVADDEPLFAGRILGRRYQLDRKIGEGGMGVVYLARDLVEADFSEQPFVAIKVLKPNFREHPDALRALHEEVRKSRSLSHPNIVSVYTFDRDASAVFMTMEYLEGKPLDELIEEDYARGMPFAQAWPVIEGAGRALAYAHDRGVVHSDFKPSNVFVTASQRPKVLDFGIARAMRQGRVRGFDAGTLGAMTELYASCEMLGGEPADLRDDVYAFACVIYELLSGRHVCSGQSAAAARDAKFKVAPLPGLTKLQNAALSKALSFDRDKRTGSIEAVLEGLKPQTPVKRTGAFIAVAVICVLLLAGGFWWASRHFGGPNQDEAFVNSLLKPNAEVSAPDPEEIALLMEQGGDYLTQARAHFDAAVLSEGISTARGAFQAVLKLDPANRVAAEKILEIVKMYEAQARTLQEQGQFKRASMLVQYGLKINPNDSTLKALQRELAPKAASDATSTP